jgi:hypothetical protein
MRIMISLAIYLAPLLWLANDITCNLWPCLWVWVNPAGATDAAMSTTVPIHNSATLLFLLGCGCE